MKKSQKIVFFKKMFLAQKWSHFESKNAEKINRNSSLFFEHFLLQIVSKSMAKSKTGARGAPEGPKLPKGRPPETISITLVTHSGAILGSALLTFIFLSVFGIAFWKASGATFMDFGIILGQSLEYFSILF